MPWISREETHEQKEKTDKQSHVKFSCESFGSIRAMNHFSLFFFLSMYYFTMLLKNVAVRSIFVRISFEASVLFYVYDNNTEFFSNYIIDVCFFFSNKSSYVYVVIFAVVFVCWSFFDDINRRIKIEIGKSGRSTDLPAILDFQFWRINKWTMFQHVICYLVFFATVALLQLLSMCTVCMYCVQCMARSRSHMNVLRLMICLFVVFTLLS